MAQQRQSETAGGTSRAVFFVGALFAIAFAVFWGVRTFQNHEAASASEDWPTTQGEVTLSRVATDTSAGEIMYRAEVRYQYTVEGRTFTADRIGFTPTVTSDRRSGVGAIVREYPGGKVVEVAYNPEDPSDAVLEAGYPLSALALDIAITVLPLALGVGLAIVGVRRPAGGAPPGDAA